MLTSRISQMSQMSMAMSQMSMTMWKMCTMFDISQMISRVQVTVEKISWKMFPKKYIQMGNMQTMIISMGEIIKKLFLKGFRGNLKQVQLAPSFCGEGSFRGLVWNNKSVIENPSHKAHLLSKQAYYYPRIPLKAGKSNLKIFYWGNIISESFRLRTQAWTWNWNKFSETISNSKQNMGIVFTILTVVTKQQNLSGPKMQLYQR